MFAFCASLRLAVVVILAIAAVLGVATFYEARYGAPAVLARVYGSHLFLATLSLLAINVMAAAIYRYPWKRKQTGFVVTHLGILTLLAGCLVSYRTSVDGMVVMRPGESAKDIALRAERLQVQLGGQTFSVPAEYWAEAGYPSALRAMLPGWPEPKWVGPGPVYEVAPGATVEVLEWLPAARPAGAPVGPFSGSTGDESFVAANVKPAKMIEAMRAIRVALTVDGQRREAWLGRGASRGLDTPRGVATLAYGFEAKDLAFTIAMVSAKRTNDPGTEQAATYESAVLVTQSDGSKVRQTITLNEPLVVGNPLWGYTFTQTGFDDSMGEIVSTLAVRKDPGTAAKYVGSGLICLGIFLMFYMKAYFQKPRAETSPKSEHELVGGAA